MSTIVFALLAAFVLWKLRSVLGTRNGEERRRPSYLDRGPDGARPKADDGANIVRLPGSADALAGKALAPEPDPTERWKGFAAPGSKTWAGLDAIAAADPSFSAQAFLDGAKAAYEAIISAFAASDRETLGNLLAKDVFTSFDQALTEREKRGETVETTFVSVDKPLIEDAELNGRMAQMTLRFTAGMITATRDKDGAVIDGSADKVSEVNDLWTFARDVGSRDPNWRLIATGAGV
ncbi:Tim44/TimA family putative adaptor protein [Methylocapsa palsarum]|nr:Tim44/TimA family putative adaptor protein [Methylocapsa palsarum]